MGLVCKCLCVCVCEECIGGVYEECSADVCTFTEVVEGGLGTDGLLLAGAAGLPYLL